MELVFVSVCSEDQWLDKDGFISDLGDLNVNDAGKVWGHYCKEEKSENCFECGHSYKYHVHTRYDFYVYDVKEELPEVKDKIINEEEGKALKEMYLAELEDRIASLEKERDMLKKYMVRFTYFLSQNSITIFNDAYAEYVNHLITTGTGDPEYHKSNLREHILEKEAFEQTLKSENLNNKESEISVKSINGYIEELFNLQFSGPMIKNGLQVQKESCAEDRQFTEVQHTIVKKPPGLLGVFKRTFFKF